MATIGVEYVDSFSHAREFASQHPNDDFGSGGDLYIPYYIAEWFAPHLADAGHEVRFLRSNLAVGERHMRNPAGGGEDVIFADRVDLFLIITHGRYRDKHGQSFKQCKLLFDTELDSFEGFSSEWRFGENCNLEWLLIYGCHTIDGANILDHLQMFQGLHLICGAYDVMHESWTLCEVGGDTADNLICGKPVSEAWVDGVTDWFLENHPMVISVERFETWHDGDPDWPNTVLRSDHLWGHGTARQDILPTQQFWMAVVWSEAGLFH
jgi:hypothetical protein